MTRTTTNPFDLDHLREECAIFGIYGTSEANINTALGLHARNIAVRRLPELSALTGGIFMRIAALAMLVKILTLDRLKCRRYTVTWRLGITAIRQVAKPMP